MDWMTSGALTENRELRSSNHKLCADVQQRRHDFHELSKVNERILAENKRLIDKCRELETALRAYLHRTEVDSFVSDQQKISDLNTRIQGLENRLKRANQSKKC